MNEHVLIVSAPELAQPVIDACLAAGMTPPRVVLQHETYEDTPLIPMEVGVYEGVTILRSLREAFDLTPQQVKPTARPTDPALNWTQIPRRGQWTGRSRR